MNSETFILPILKNSETVYNLDLSDRDEFEKMVNDLRNLRLIYMYNSKMHHIEFIILCSIKASNDSRFFRALMKKVNYYPRLIKCYIEIQYIKIFKKIIIKCHDYIMVNAPVARKQKFFYFKYFYFKIIGCKQK